MLSSLHYLNTDIRSSYWMQKQIYLYPGSVTERNWALTSGHCMCRSVLWFLQKCLSLGTLWWTRSWSDLAAVRKISFAACIVSLQPNVVNVLSEGEGQKSALFLLILLLLWTSLNCRQRAKMAGYFTLGRYLLGMRDEAWPVLSWCNQVALIHYGNWRRNWLFIGWSEGVKITEVVIFYLGRGRREAWKRAGWMEETKRRHILKLGNC